MAPVDNSACEFGFDRSPVARDESDSRATPKFYCEFNHETIAANARSGESRRCASFGPVFERRFGRRLCFCLFEREGNDVRGRDRLRR